MSRLAFPGAWALVLGLPLAGAAVPDRPLRVPPAQPPVSLAGTTWAGLGEGIDTGCTLMFQPGGQLTYRYPNGQTLTKATWKAEGNVVTFEINDSYREFRGTVTGGTLAGDSWNRAGARWRTSLRRAGAAP